MRPVAPIVAAICLLAGFGFPTRDARGQSPPWRVLTPIEYGEGTFLSIRHTADRQPVLMVRYPWATHSRPSIEIRQILDEDAPPSRIRPLRFRYNAFWEETKVDIYRAREEATDIRRIRAIDAFFPERKMTFNLYRQRNSLGRGAAMLAERFPTMPDGSHDSAVAWAIFPLLEDWSSDERTLHLDLPEAYFGQPMRLRVWLLRFGDTLWSEEIDWPGY